jgi:hypothetical protein
MVNISAVAETLQPRPSRLRTMSALGTDTFSQLDYESSRTTSDSRCNWMLEFLYLLVRRDHVIHKTWWCSSIAIGILPGRRFRDKEELQIDRNVSSTLY